MIRQNPAFGPQEMRELTEIFVEKALEVNISLILEHLRFIVITYFQLRDIWSTEIIKHDGVGPIECLSWMSRTTLDIIGLAGKTLSCA